MGRIDTNQVKLIMVIHLFDWLKPKTICSVILPNAFGTITYKQLSKIKVQNLRQFGYEGQSYLYLLDDNIELIYSSWEIKYNKIDKDPLRKERQLYILVKTGMQAAIDQLESRTRLLQLEVMNLKSQNEELLKRNAIIENKNIDQLQKCAKPLDMALFFSQPLFGQTTVQKPPVTFQTQIRKIYQECQNSDIDILCEVATMKKLKYVLSNYKPRILHIMCHGDAKGNLKFQESLKSKIGVVDLITPQRIYNQLKQLQSFPQVVFINACHSQKVGKVFLDLGANYVVCINQDYQIRNEASETFSEVFYSQIVKGQTVIKAYAQAKKKVRVVKKSCCCHHSHYPHKCSMPQKKMKADKIHQNWHVPKNNCKCQTDKSERQKDGLHHKNCKWALTTLKQLNKNYSKNKLGVELMEEQDLINNNLLSQDGKIAICCCSSVNDPKFFQHAKFKLYNAKNIQNQPVFIKKDKNSKQENLFHDHSSDNIKKRQTQLVNVKYRQKYLYQLITNQRRHKILLIRGQKGCGRTSFARKAANYLYTRQQIKGFRLIDLIEVNENKKFIDKIEKLNIYKKTINQQQNQNSKNYVVILDNCDAILTQDFNNFVNQLEQYKNFNTLQFYLIIENKTEKFLPSGHSLFDATTVLRQIQTCRDVCNVLYQQIKGMLKQNQVDQFERQIVILGQALKFPKVLKVFCQRLRQMNRNEKISLIEIKRNFIKFKQTIFSKEWQEKLIQESLKSLLQINGKLLIPKYVNFIAQFSNGISFEDLDRLSNFNENMNNMSVLAQKGLPILKDWRKQTQHLLIDKSKRIQKIIEEDNSYFLAGAKQKVQLKSHMRLYLMKDDKNQNFANRFGFVAYICSLLQFFFKRECKNPTKAKSQLVKRFLEGIGIFSLDTSVEANYNPQIRGTHSSFQGANFNAAFQGLFQQNGHIKIKEKIEVHIDDINSLYDLTWEKNEQNDWSNEIFLCYFYNLLVYIPFFFMYVKDDSTSCLLKIEKSLEIFNKTKIDSKKLQKRNLLFEYKLKIMKAYTALYTSPNNSMGIFEEMENDFKPVFGEQLNFMIKLIIQVEKQYFQLYQLSKKDRLEGGLQSIQPYIKYYQENFNNEKYRQEYSSYLARSSSFGSQPGYISEQKMKLLYKGIDLPIYRYGIVLTKACLGLLNHEYQSQEIGQKVLTIIKHCFDNLQKSENYLGLQAGKLYVRLLNRLKKQSISIQTVVNKLLSLEKKVSSNLKCSFELTLQIQALKDEIDLKVWNQAKNTIIFMKANPIFKSNTDKYGDFDEKFKILSQSQSKSSSNLSPSILNESIPKTFSQICNRVWKNQLDEQSFIIKRRSLTQQNLKENNFKASLLLIQANAFINTQGQFGDAILAENRLKQEVALPINEQYFSNFKDADVLVLVGEMMTRVAFKISKLLNRPKVIIGIDSNGSEKQALSPDYKHGQQFIIQKFTFKLLETLKQQVANIQQLQKIYTSILQEIDIDQSSAVFFKSQNAQINLNFKSNYKQYSTDTYCVNNLDNLTLRKPFLRRLEPMHQIFKLLNYTSKIQTQRWINLYGPLQSGRTSFIIDLAKLLIQMQAYQGIFILQGKVIQQQYMGQIYKYLDEESFRQKIPSRDELFKQRKQQPWLIILDDFDKIKPSEEFLNELAKSRATVIFISVEPQVFMMKKWKSISVLQLKTLKQKEVDIITQKKLGNITNSQLIEQLKKIKLSIWQHKTINISKLLQILQRYIPERPKSKKTKSVFYKNSYDSNNY